MIKQQILGADNDYAQLDRYLKNCGHTRVLLVCGESIRRLKIGAYFDSLEERLGIKVIRFSDFKPNPIYKSVVEGVRILNREACSLIIAVGGGSAMDVAKCIKLYANMNHTQNYLKQKIIPNNIAIIAIPTTAGTGSEATQFAVIYYNGEKQSVANESCIPSVVVMDPSALKSLPEYQRKSTMMDAFCHAIESFWSVNSTQISREYAKNAITLILSSYPGYLAIEDTGNAVMLQAANLEVKAINITQTTAGHAMCYKLTSLYGIAHGHAAALCISKLFPYMVSHMDKCIDPRGQKYLQNIFESISKTFGCADPHSAAKKFDEILAALALNVPKPKPDDYKLLSNSINPVRLKNHPIKLDREAIDQIYHQILPAADD